ncbi:MAG TPA: hypothetical protein VMH04_11715 [Candidatus Solibacter sp.]|nr:hypothetical protein [Candidatus Solibacter sp.]
MSVLFAPSLFAQHEQASSIHLSEPHRQISLAGLSGTWHRYWDKDYLITYGTDSTSEATPDRPSVTLYDRSGKVAREAVVWFPDAYSVGINDAAVGKSGTLVVAAGARNQQGVIANFIAAIDTTGHMTNVIRTTPFLPIYVCAAEDGTVWSFGLDRDADGKRVKESAMLRQYSFDKGQINALLYQSALKSTGWELSRGRYPGEISLRCTSQRVGLYNACAGQYVEIDLPTGRLTASKVEPVPSPHDMHVTGFALTEAGDVFVSLWGRSGDSPHSGIFKLSFDAEHVGSWVPVANSSGPYLHGGPVERLLGTDGTELIYTRDLDSMAYWSKTTNK